MRIITARPHRLLDVCAKRIGALAEAGESCMFLVPSQYTLQAEIELMTRLDLEGSFLIDVLSPSRLRSRVFERTGEPDRIVFDERGKCMVLRGILEEEKDNLIAYRAAASGGGDGLAQRMSAMIADLKRSEVTPEELALKIGEMDADHPAKRKMLDIARIYAAYEGKMQGHLADSEEISRIVREKMERHHVLNGQYVFVYGFDMITPTFAADLVHMAKQAKSLTLAIETDKNAAPDGRLFAPVNASIDRLCALARDMDVEVEREEVKGEIDATEEIRAMERGLFALGGAVYQEKVDAIEMQAASSPRMEVHLAAARIRKLLEQGYDPADIAVVYPKAGGYGPLLENILPMYDLPVYVAQKRAAGAHPLCRFILSALAVVSGGWRTSDVIECIQSGFLGLNRDQADALCAYAEGVDLRMDAWKHPFTYIKSGKQDELDSLNASRERVVSPILSLAAKLNSAKTADDTVMAVIALLEETDAFGTLEAMRLELEEEGFIAQADDCAQVSVRLMETLDQLHTLLGGESVSAKVVLELLSSGLSAMELAALPPADGAIICGEIGNIRTAQVGTIFAIGMNDAAQSAQTGLLSPAETEEAARVTGAYMGMSAAERAALAQLDVLKTLTCARSRLVVSYALADETGRALREGDAVQAMKRLYPGLKIGGGLLKEEFEEMLGAPRPAAQALAVMLSDAADERGELELAAAQSYAALAKDETGKRRLIEITRKLGEPARAPLDASQAGRSTAGR